MSDNQKLSYNSPKSLSLNTTKELVRYPLLYDIYCFHIWNYDFFTHKTMKQCTKKIIVHRFWVGHQIRVMLMREECPLFREFIPLQQQNKSESCGIIRGKNNIIHLVWHHVVFENAYWHISILLNPDCYLYVCLAHVRMSLQGKFTDNIASQKILNKDM